MFQYIFHLWFSWIGIFSSNIYVCCVMLISVSWWLRSRTRDGVSLEVNKHTLLSKSTWIHVKAATSANLSAPWQWAHLSGKAEAIDYRWKSRSEIGGGASATGKGRTMMCFANNKAQCKIPALPLFMFFLYNVEINSPTPISHTHKLKSCVYNQLVRSSFIHSFTYTECTKH